MASLPPGGIEARRHDLIRLLPSCDRRVGAELDGADRSGVQAWVSAGRPFVVRSQPRPFASDRIALGLPLPPAAAKRRIALEVDRACVSAVERPPLLDATLHALSAMWCDALATLDRSAKHVGIVLRVYGSIAFQSLTGLPYLHAASDVDLLWTPPDRGVLAAGLAVLAAWERSSGLRADGEILFGASGVSWREWQRGAPRVLVKSIEGPALRDRAELLALLDAGVPEESVA